MLFRGSCVFIGGAIFIADKGRNKMEINGYIIKPGANLEGADLVDANLVDANLVAANLVDADLMGANLWRADLRYAVLREAVLRGANLQEADLRYAVLRGADLMGADLRGADLMGADLRGADLRRADLSGAKGLISASEWLKTNFKSSKKGYIVFKAFGDTYYKYPKSWRYKKFITEVVNHNRTDVCGCGVNFATEAWIDINFQGYLEEGTVRKRKMILHWEDLPDVVVPYNTDGKARCGRLEKGEWVKCGGR
jgi:hypothetical protein